MFLDFSILESTSLGYYVEVPISRNRLDQTGPDWTGLDWTGLDWTMQNWTLFHGTDMHEFYLNDDLNEEQMATALTSAIHT